MKNQTRQATVNTSESILSRPPTEGEIDRQFEDIERLLEEYERENVMIPGGGYPGGDSVELGYNGRMFLIRRGETVRLPAPLAQVLRDAMMI